jgi:hypothetical protein
MTLTLQLPLPDPALRSNGSFGNAWVYRNAFRKAKAQAVAEAERVLTDAGMVPPRWDKVAAVVTQYHITPQRLDPDNLIAACKAYFDGIAAAGLVANDKNLFPDRPRFERVAKFPRIEISISPIP